MEPNFVRIAGDIINGVLTDLSAMGAASLLEDEIKKRKFGAMYVYELASLCDEPFDSNQHYSVHAVFVLLCATPKQRAQAFLGATGDDNT